MTDPDDDDAPGVEPTDFFGDELFSHPVVDGDLKGDAILPPAPDRGKGDR